MVALTVVVLVVVVVVCVPPEAAAARALPLADSMSATTGGVTAAKRPAFSRNRRRSASFAVRFASSGISVHPTDHTLPSKLLGHERSSKAGSSARHLDTGSRISPKSVSPGTRGGRLP